MRHEMHHAYLISLHRDKHFRSPITHQSVFRRQLHCLIEQREGTFSIPAPLYSLDDIPVSATYEHPSACSAIYTPFLRSQAALHYWGESPQLSYSDIPPFGFCFSSDNMSLVRT